MPRLTPAELRSRLALDYRTLAGLSRETIGRIDGHAGAVEVLGPRPLPASVGLSGEATAYAVEYRFPHLVGPGATSPSAVAVFDLLAGGNYPFTSPGAAFVSRPLPWSPHVHPGSGIICLGDAWKASGGRMLFAQLVVHVMRLMNFDEPDRSMSGHLNASAAGYWHAVLRGRPYLPELRYPRLPSEITHGVDAARDFEDAANGFRAVRSNGEDEDDTFRPIGR